ncbi:hypothetical protein [Shewanella sedimentimangrovi]|uniref:Uncharacterized protein n=1 Tax=Shewanella sedimentimangrovi TaxID=2814293 RepID=A0ABX7R2K4_9GAMM|nr:hypothetical protein [Shewanella sedimentimangrovi]QSX37944.1 hypothetical protein JYB85_03630 [Shewanella sedimentimangrovi]
MRPRRSHAGKIDSANAAKAKLDILQNAYDGLRQKQSAYRTLLGSLLGTVPALALLAYLNSALPGVLVLYLVPPLIIGLSARALGHCYQWPLLLIPGAVALLSLLVALLSMPRFNFLDFIIVPAGVGLAMFVARKRLTVTEQKALWQAKLGKLK